jgi:hypothetical protein
MTRLALCLVALVLGAAWVVGDVGAALAQAFVNAFPGVAS